MIIIYKLIECNIQIKRKTKYIIYLINNLTVIFKKSFCVI